MVARGVTVTGSDAKDSAALEALRALGVDCFVGHAAAARRRRRHGRRLDGRPGRQPRGRAGPRARPAAVAAGRGRAVGAARAYDAVVVTGTHGKTTTTSMLATALLACGADPSYAIGSTLNASGLNAAAGSGPIFVAEGDESDARDLGLHAGRGGRHQRRRRPPRLLRHRRGLRRGLRRVRRADRRRAASWSAASTTPGPRGWPAGRRRDRPRRGHGRQARRRATCARLGLSFAGQTSTYEVWARRRPARRGRAAGARPALRASTRWPPWRPASQLGFGFDGLAAGLASFRGSGRRMELKGEAGGVRVFDSYAHHPSEIAGDLRAARVDRRATAGWSSASSRTCSAGPGSSPPRWGRRSVPPTRSS